MPWQYAALHIDEVTHNLCMEKHYSVCTVACDNMCAMLHKHVLCINTTNPCYLVNQTVLVSVTLYARLHEHVLTLTKVA